MHSFLPSARYSDFSIHNLPYGIFSVAGGAKRVGVAIGNTVLDLAGVAELGLLDKTGCEPAVLVSDYLNDFIAQGRTVTRAVRERLQTLLVEGNTELPRHPDLLHDRTTVDLHLPVRIGDYTDFYSSKEHATNVGKLFRDPENALLPNWRHLPVGYHGRASTVVPSGTPIKRPHGQTKAAEAEGPVFGPSRQLDFELETGFIIGRENRLGQPVPIEAAEEYIFGMVLVNDWSARDIQRWEYVPLGPFLGKSFATSISHWVVPLEALEPFRVSGPVQEPAVLPYLQSTAPANFDIDLAVHLQPSGGPEVEICRSNTRYLYWSQAQQLTHHASNGCQLRVGDLLASGTISGPDEHSYGSLLELSEAGRKPVSLGGEFTRTFLEDGDRVRLTARAERGGVRVGFGEVVGVVE